MRVLTITTPDVENGLGNRVTIWFAGCSHRCVGCHNQHTWDYNQGTPLFDDGVIEKIFSEVDKDYISIISMDDKILKIKCNEDAAIGDTFNVFADNVSINMKVVGLL